MIRQVYRCSDGHLYTASWLKMLVFSLHLGVGRHFQRCPVDRRWRLSARMSRDDLSDKQLAQASRHVF